MTLALTHYNRYHLLREAIAQVQDDPRINEIVISDDASTDGSWERLQHRLDSDPKVRLYRNERNLDCYSNKKMAVERATNPWVILFDSDNIMSPSYLDALDAAAPWDPRTAYLPVAAEPQFDYTAFAGLTVTRRTIRAHIDQPLFLTALNTANFLVHRDEYLRVWDPAAQPHTSDSIYLNYCWLRAGNALHFVPGLRYYHRIHPGSHFVHNFAKTGSFAAEVEARLRKMR